MIMFACYLGCGAVKSSRNSTGALSIRLPRRFLSSKQIRPPVNHYEILGLTSKSTQAEIKASFYKLSKVFHPDVSDQSEESAVKFRQITTAYEILGNLKLRKMYDKGLLPRDGLISQEVDVAYEDCETQSPFKKTRSQPATGRTTVYDYDQWSRLHYGTTLNRRTVAKEKWQSKYDARINETEFKKSDNAIAFVLLSIIILAGLHMLGKPNYDVIKENYKRP